MKILHYSDKGAADFLTLYAQCDVLVTTGDLSGFDLAGLGEMKEKKPAFGVYGNHDFGNYMPEAGIINLHNQVAEFGGWKWGGWQGCLRYKPGAAPMFTEAEAKEFADTFPAVDVLLLHAGPKGMLDDDSDELHAGSEQIRRYVLSKRPKVVFCGHQYEDGETEAEGIRIFRTFGARIIEI
jgi:Icc-related predicted phosphoesterase